MGELNLHPIILSYIQFNEFGKLLGMNFSIQSPGEVMYKLQIQHDFLATPKAAHGGVVASLMDATLGVAALSKVCEFQKVVSTIELTVRYHAPVLIEDSLTAYGSILSAGNRIITSEAKVFNQHKQLVASGTGTFNAYPKEKAGL